MNGIDGEIILHLGLPFRGAKVTATFGHQVKTIQDVVSPDDLCDTMGGRDRKQQLHQPSKHASIFLFFINSS